MIRETASDDDDGIIAPTDDAGETTPARAERDAPRAAAAPPQHNSDPTR